MKWHSLRDVVRLRPCLSFTRVLAVIPCHLVAERIVVGVDFNGNVGDENGGVQRVQGHFGMGKRNNEGEQLLEFVVECDMAIANTFFQKMQEHQMTYKSGDKVSQTDYILCRRGKWKEVNDLRPYLVMK